MTAPDFQGREAGIVTRSLAAAIDLLVVGVVLVGLWFATAAVTFLSRPARFVLPSPSWATVTAVGLAVAILYLTTCWATSGRSYGDQLLGLRVVARSAERLGWARSFLRATAYVLVPVGLVWSVVDRDRRSLQDLLVGSRVVYDWVPRSPAPARPAVPGA